MYFLCSFFNGLKLHACHTQNSANILNSVYTLECACLHILSQTLFLFSCLYYNVVPLYTVHCSKCSQMRKCEYILEYSVADPNIINEPGYGVDERS
jgi:hypothetical protein